jgi:hypothetical protein
MPRWDDYEDSVVDFERDESRAARHEDRRDLRRIGDRWIEADRVPDPSDCVD